MQDHLFDDRPKAKTPPSPRRKQMPDPLKVWLVNRFFGGHVATKQGTSFGEAVKLFREKKLGPEELELRCQRHDDRWAAHCGPVTLRGLLNKIDELTQPTDAEKKRAAERRKLEAEQAKWLADRREIKETIKAHRATCARLGHDGGSPETCWRCRWIKQHDWDEEPKP